MGLGVVWVAFEGEVEYGSGGVGWWCLDWRVKEGGRRQVSLTGV